MINKSLSFINSLKKRKTPSRFPVINSSIPSEEEDSVRLAPVGLSVDLLKNDETLSETIMKDRKQDYMKISVYLVFLMQKVMVL